MKSFTASIASGEEGFAIHNSVYLPFHCEIISIWIGKEMSLLSVPDQIVDLADTEVIGIREGESYTNLVFRKWGDLTRELAHHKGHIILYVAEKGEDIFNSDNLHYIRIGFHTHRKGLTFEIINDPFRL
jgi:hypothetical protein